MDMQTVRATTLPLPVSTDEKRHKQFLQNDSLGTLQTPTMTHLSAAHPLIPRHAIYSLISIIWFLVVR